MTTKKFQLIHYCKDGNENYRTDYNTYNEAVTAMCNELKRDDNFMSPKDFDIIEVEEKSELAQVCDEVVTIMDKNDTEPTKVVASCHANEDGEPFTIATIERKATHLPLCGCTIIMLANLMQEHPNLGWWVSLPEGNICISNNPARAKKETK